MHRSNKIHCYFLHNLRKNYQNPSIFVKIMTIFNVLQNVVLKFKTLPAHLRSGPHCLLSDFQVRVVCVCACAWKKEIEIKRKRCIYLREIGCNNASSRYWLLSSAIGKSKHYRWHDMSYIILKLKKQSIVWYMTIDCKSNVKRVITRQRDSVQLK